MLSLSDSLRDFIAVSFTNPIMSFNSLESNRGDDEHRLIARYAARLADTRSTVSFYFFPLRNSSYVIKICFQILH